MCLRFALWGSKDKDVRNAYRYRVQLYYGKKTPGGASGTEPYVTRLDDSKIVLLFGKALIKLVIASLIRALPAHLTRRSQRVRMMMRGLQKHVERTTSDSHLRASCALVTAQGRPRRRLYV